ncbi:MAG: hypothetical protein HKL84_08645 [Acidimicrobiaceae bacterium]|nr:hypothetical protein [Acidimicrobiaceae bacterium]
MNTAADTLDPIKYEIFMHRLWAVGEEGRIALQRVSASPIVVQGGECMQSFYDPNGRMILACSGHLRFAAATSDAIKKIVEWFGTDPGFYEGDQIFNNDPYVAGSHTYDQMVIKPIFYQGRLIAWTASSSHTADTGGVMRGAATEIFHEGLRILGLKIVERGQFRNDVCRSIVEQCRDPYYVELDLRSRIAGNNVSAQRFLELVDQFGVDFVEQASQKLMDDSERMARAKLQSLPDGTWRSRMFASGMRRPDPYQIICEMTKSGDSLTFDFAGTSPQLNDDQNSTLPSTLAHVTLALTNTLFWDVPWSDGKMVPVKVMVPEGSLLNCKFPAACGGAPRVGQILVSAVSECVAKMLYAGGRYEDINAGWQGLWYEGGPGYFYGGHTRQGIPVAQGLYDIHGGGFGATPLRDGVDSGGHSNIPSGGISDVEWIELQYPFLYLTRNHAPNGAGYGARRGGDGTHRVYMAYGSQDLSVDFRPYAGIPNGGFGLFGGFPAGSGGFRAVFRTNAEDMQRRMSQGEYPTSPAQILNENWGEALEKSESGPHARVPEWGLISDFTQGGGGFGDPLERSIDQLQADIAGGIYNRWSAERFFGASTDDNGNIDVAATDKKRAERRSSRLSGMPGAISPHASREVKILSQPHAELDIVETGQGPAWCCHQCRTLLGSAKENYKKLAEMVVEPLDAVSEFPLPSGDPFIGEYVYYFCPGCGVQLQVDVYCPKLGGERLWWDIQIKLP